ncbi:endonuclease/exonuclease/phosphatase family protein [Photobacterium kasasachensis]|uniref:endonuclease/exonuclease/phosphatase family protein n=1 Tax=Photobacterium kasasachensis TaxID=2910240 RepID=UPI003D0AF80E
MKTKCIRIVLTALAFYGFASVVAAKPLKITTWNAEHLMSEDRFKEWKAYCEPLDWSDKKSSVNTQNKNEEKPPRLTYCNALSWPKAVRTLDDHRKKIISLRALADDLQSDIYFFQEVSDAKAIDELLNNSSYVSISSYELLEDTIMPQNVGIAYRKDLFDEEPFITVNKDVMVLHKNMDGKERPVRPGIELNGSINGKELTFLNLHMKSSCHELKLDNSKIDCKTFANQVYVLEEWIEGMVKNEKDFVLLGDFNRVFDLDWSFEARSDGGNAKDKPTDESQTRSFLHEINDGKPESVAIYYAPNVFVRKHSDWNCYEKIDRFFLNRTFAETLMWKTPALGLEAIGTNYPDFGRDKVRPSDHCPITLELPL